MKFYLRAKAKKTQVMLLILLVALVSGCTSLKRCAYEGFIEIAGNSRSR
jgi:hypothetical protein